MKTFTKTSYALKHLLLAIVFLASSRLFSQSLNFTINPVTQCAAQYTTFAQAAVTSSMAGTTSYSWAFGCTSCNPSLYYNSFNSNASSIGIAYLNVGTTTVTCFAYSGSNIIGSVTKTLQVLASPPAFNISSTSAGNLCVGSSATLSVLNAGSYTWAPSGIVASSIVVTPTASACYSASIVNGNNCYFSNSFCLNVAANSPTLNLVPSGNFLICGTPYGNFGYLGVSGATNYTWTSNSPQNNGSNSSNILLNALGCYSVTGSNGCGTATAVACAIGAAPPPILSITGPATVCAGQQTTLTANGNNGINTYPTYYWYAASPNNSAVSQSYSLVINPLANACYTLYGQNPACSNQTSYCVTVVPGSIPTLSFSGGTNYYCQGSVASLTVTGNASSYLWSNSTTGTVITLSPNSNTCLTVTGTNAGGCSASATKCYTVLPTPSLTVSGNSSVCLGSSINFTATGANSYTWNPGGANTSTLNVLPLSSGIYTLNGSIATSSCLGTKTLAVTVNTACAIVWPGDANRDGLVDNTDVFELGLAAASTGGARSGASISWSGQYASAWTGIVSSGWNKCHADCNGDGTVNNADTLAIYNNYANTHGFRSSASSFNPDLTLAPQQVQAYGGVWNVINIELGDASNNINQIYGAAFDLDYDQNMVESDSVKLIYTSSFLNASNQNITFGKKVFNSGKVFAASVRTDAANVNGSGKIAEIWFKLKTGLAEGSSFYFGISNGKRINAGGISGTLSTAGQMNLTLTNDVTALKESNGNSMAFVFYPNPVKDKLTMENGVAEITHYTLSDISGRKIATGSFSGKSTMDVSGFDAGTYFIEFESANGKSIHKVVLEK